MHSGEMITGGKKKKRAREREYVLSLEQLWEEQPQEGIQRPGKFSLFFTAREVFHRGAALNSFVCLMGMMACVRAGCYRLSKAHRQLRLARVEPVKHLQYHCSSWNKFYSVGLSLKTELPSNCPDRSLSLPSWATTVCHGVWYGLEEIPDGLQLWDLIPFRGNPARTWPRRVAGLPTVWKAAWEWWYFFCLFFCPWAMCAPFNLWGNIAGSF